MEAPLSGCSRHPDSGSGRARLGAASVLAATLGVLLLAAVLRPDAEGVGTHRQLGLPGCGLYSRSGIPCPTCGMTTAFAHAANGDLHRAAAVQPAGAILAVATAMAAVAAAWVLVRGVVPPLRVGAATKRRLVVLAVAVLIAAWSYKLRVTLH